MNKILIILLAIITISCSKRHEDQPQEQSATVYEQKYPIGTVMYVKPDSLKVVVIEYDSTEDTYRCYWREGGEYFDAWYGEVGFYGDAEALINISNE